MPINKKGKTVIAIGGFNAVHKGHAKLVRRAAELAQAKDCRAVIFTFDEKLELHKKNKYFLSDKEREKLLLSLGADEVYVQNFTKGFMELSPEKFVTDVLIKKFDCAAVVVGENFRFGKNASGDAELLRDICSENGIECHVEDLEKTDGGAVISSSLLRNLALDGRVDEVYKYCGRPLKISGKVIHGREEGRKIGFPTANFIPPETALLPGNGVYSSQVVIDGKTYSAITNIGSAPTYGETAELAETHIIGLNKDLYGKNLEVFLLKKLRNIQNFGSREKLISQLENDKKISVLINQQKLRKE